MPPLRKLWYPWERCKSAITCLALVLLLTSLAANMCWARTSLSSGEKGMLDERELIGAAGGDPNGGHDKTAPTASPSTSVVGHSHSKNGQAEEKNPWPLRFFTRAMRRIGALVATSGGR